tara:strand:- start:395 stop:664 length:270 start_codon:yes stop_codon:yes gene_type:complete
MKKELKKIAGELKKASALHKGQAAKIDKLLKPKLSKLNKTKRKKRAIARKKLMISNAMEMVGMGKVSKKRAAKDIKRKEKAIKRKQSKI